MGRRGRAATSGDALPKDGEATGSGAIALLNRRSLVLLNRRYGRAGTCRSRFTTFSPQVLGPFARSGESLIAHL